MARHVAGATTYVAAFALAAALGGCVPTTTGGQGAGLEESDIVSVNGLSMINGLSMTNGL
jgi:hypothetical protein